MFNRSRSSILLIAPLLFLAPAPQKTFLKLATVRGTVDATVSQLRTAIGDAGWTVLASYDAGVNAKKCDYRAHVVIAHWPEYADAMLQVSEHGAFAAAVRYVVFEDEAGIHVGAVNPRSLNRTIVAEEGHSFESFAQRIEAVVHARLPGVTAPYGQARSQGRIGKTMGVMAGGPFAGKVEVVADAPIDGQSLDSFASQVYGRLEKLAGAGEWQLRPVFRQMLSADVAVVGMASATVESRSFDIVGAGGDGTRGQMRCPGIDHAAAYPVEVVLVRVGDRVEARIIDEMFRMKMYFEDAGKMAFAKNMGMPGSIEEELRRKVRSAFPARPVT